jgi:hypothetical protein
MDEFLKSYEKNIKTKHSFNITPKYKEEFITSVNSTLFIAIAEKTFEKLDWELVYKDKNSAEARRKVISLGMESWTEAITVSYDYGNVIVKSESLGDEIWDFGRNSRRVKLFIYAFEAALKTFDRASLNELEKEADKKNNWDDYVIPETLPPPKEVKKPNIAIPILGGLLLSLILGLAVAYISIKVIYLIGLFELLVAIAIAFVMKHLIKLSNFTDFNKLQFLLVVMIILIYLSNQYFQYEIILKTNNFERIGFWEFLKLRFSAGLTIKGLNLGWIGLVISWIVQLGLTMLLVYLKVVSNLTKYLIEKVPVEVLDFANYHFVKEKSEDEVRNELSKKGWSNVKNQDEVFDAIGGLQASSELSRVK